MLIEMLDTNEDGEVDSFEWTTMLSQVRDISSSGRGGGGWCAKNDPAQLPPIRHEIWNPCFESFIALWCATQVLSLEFEKEGILEDSVSDYEELLMVFWARNYPTLG